MSNAHYLYTRAPLTYVTGGLYWCNGVRLDRDLKALHPDALDMGGPLDAPEVMPTGRVKVAQGIWFAEMAYREGDAP